MAMYGKRVFASFAMKIFLRRIQMKIIMIRHGMTQWNKERRYVGSTDLPLCDDGRKELIRINEERPLEADVIYVSPMKRCLETARIFFGQRDFKVVEDLREYDFGEYEGLDFKELSKDPKYTEWLKEHKVLPFPEGEGMDNFKKRVSCAFEKVMREICNKDEENVALVVHGGTIMNILSEYCEEVNEYYDIHPENGDAYSVFWDKMFPIKLTGLQKIL